MRATSIVLGAKAVSQYILALAVVCSVGVQSRAVVTSTTQHGAAANSFDSMMSSTDLIQGRKTLDVDVYENPADSFGNPSNIGWHPANTDPADQLAAFTDGAGMRASHLTGLLNDFPPASGSPTKIVEYPFAAPVDIGRINIFSGNFNNADGRIFSTTYIEYSTNNGFTYQPLGYFQSDPSGTINNANNPVPPLSPAQKSTLVSVFDNASSTLASGVTNIIFNLYSVDNTQGQVADPFDGVNPFTTVDDGFAKAFESPLILEIDVLPPQAGVLGDYNNNFVVDAADYVVWRDNINAATLPNRGSGITGPVSTADYAFWRSHFGSTSGLGSGLDGAAVPEPHTLGAILLGCVLASIGRRVRSTR